MTTLIGSVRRHSPAELHELDLLQQASCSRLHGKLLSWRCTLEQHDDWQQGHCMAAQQQAPSVPAYSFLAAVWLYIVQTACIEADFAKHGCNSFLPGPWADVGMEAEGIL